MKFNVVVKKTMKKSIFLVVLCCSIFSANSLLAKKTDKEAFDFTLKSMSGENIKLSELRGNVVMLNFWASWCGPCRTEMPILDKFYKKYKKLGFTLLSINIENDASGAKKFLNDVPVSFPVLLDSNKKVSKQYKVSAMPTSIFIDRDGKMRSIHKGYKKGDEKEYKRLMKELIRE